MHSISLASSLSQVFPSRIRAIADVAFAMDGVFRLHFGESNMPTPRYIKEAAAQALDEGYTFYTENAGLPGLREAIAVKYAELHQVGLDPHSEIVVTASGVQALNVSIRCVLDPGDEAIVLTPNWPNASAIVSLFGGRPREIPFVWRGQRFEIDWAALKDALTPQTRLLVYASPSNPLGWVAGTADQQALLEFCRRHRLWLLADEVYERIYYSGAVAPSILRLCTREDAVIVVQSFSKSHCMTGWRLGWLVARADLAHKAAQLNEFIVSHASSMVQRAGEIALKHPDHEIRSMVEYLKTRVAFCFEALSSMKGVSVVEPAGAFYLFPRIEGLEDSFAFALALLKENKVSVAPGVAFGRGGEGAVRVCCAADRSILEPAMERMHHFLEKR
ncbi:MAG: pyridoxal phosphate-dependent aminotransferase [Desulfobacterales bacterium]|nr:MAG: pyridoxal phosphate-dependent aminotransferase [Desulfobacterales bacterium]